MRHGTPTTTDRDLDTEGFLPSELANTATHGVGLGLSIAGLATLVVLASRYGSALHIVASSIYGTTLVALYLSSTAYHTVQAPRAKRVLQVIDHSAIYLLIAGTYTPFTLVALRGPWGWSLFGVVWGLALLGVLFKLFFTGRLRILSVVLYLAMGWLSLVAIKPLVATLSAAALAWLFGGGAAYTLGVIFFAWKRVPHHHAIWHVFVMIGSVCHFISVMYFIIPASK